MLTEPLSPLGLVDNVVAVGGVGAGLDVRGVVHQVPVDAVLPECGVAEEARTCSFAAPAFAECAFVEGWWD